MAESGLSPQALNATLITSSCASVNSIFGPLIILRVY
jgi:hypothetical protein